MYETASIPKRIETDRFILRTYEDHDIRVVHEVVNNNTTHLNQWITWAKELPITLEQQSSLILKWRDHFTNGSDFIYGIFDRTSGEYLGSTGLHTRQGKGILEIGYWVRKDRQGQGIANEVVLKMEELAFHQLHAEKIEIRCEDTNLPSARVAARAGYHHEYTYTTLERNDIGTRKKLMVWIKFREE